MLIFKGGDTLDKKKVKSPQTEKCIWNYRNLNNFLYFKCIFRNVWKFSNNIELDTRYIGAYNNQGNELLLNSIVRRRIRSTGMMTNYQSDCVTVISRRYNVRSAVVQMLYRRSRYHSVQ